MSEDIKYKQFTLEEFRALRTSGMLWELFPDACGVYEIDVLHEELKNENEP